MSERNDCTIRRARPGDQAGAYHVCLRTGDHGDDGERFYRDDPDALGRVFVGPYLAFEAGSCLILEDVQGICGYALGALDSRAFYTRYENEWRPNLCARFPQPKGSRGGWTRLEQVYDTYHHPDYYCPAPYDAYPSHLHIDLLPRAQGHGYGRRLIQRQLQAFRDRGSPGVHLGLSERNTRAFAFYRHLGFIELTRTRGADDRVIYMGMALR